MTYYFETYGCEMNIAESAAVEQLLISRNWHKAEHPEEANLVIINTCSVRGSAEQRIIGRLGYFAGVKKVRMLDPHTKLRLEDMKYAADFAAKNGAIPLNLVLMGCMAQRTLDTIQTDYPQIDYVVGTFGKYKFGEIIQNVENGGKGFKIEDEKAYTFAEYSYEQGAFSTFVPIMHGCNNFCTYCIVPYVRGREISRPVSQIFKELDFLSKANVKEICLLGQNVNAYKGEDGTTFPQLLDKICRHIDETKSSIKWIRFESSNPNDFSDELIEVIKNNPHICRGFHIAAQHGNNTVLKRMNRKNTREQFIELTKKLRATLPGVQLVTDLMVGFPGETEEQFQDVLSLMNEVKFESSFMYFYNPREGTPAATWPDQIEVDVKKARLAKVIDLQSKHTTEVMQKRIGEEIEVLADIVSKNNESELLGKTEQNERVAFAGDKKLIGNFVKVKITGLNGNTFKGELIK